MQVIIPSISNDDKDINNGHSVSVIFRYIMLTELAEVDILPPTAAIITYP